MARAFPQLKATTFNAESQARTVLPLDLSVMRSNVMLNRSFPTMWPPMTTNWRPRGKGGYEVTLSNGDLVWSQNTYGSTERGLGQAFDAYTQKKWDRAWHGKCNGVNYKTTALQLRYTFSSGNKLLTKVKVWQVPGAGHQAGQIDVMYWTGSEWEAVSGQSPSGFQSTGYGEELTISFNSVSTDQLRLDFYSHNSASNPICVGATEVQLIGCNA